ncbi:MAG TPA: multicopper oxidase domain-containing protein [Gemmatimonadaceae bacterium]
MQHRLVAVALCAAGPLALSALSSHHPAPHRAATTARADSSSCAAPAPTDSLPIPAAVPNDNRLAAGVRSSGALRLELEVRMARWCPDGDRRPAPIDIAAFAAAGGAPRIPGPLIRVRAGTRITVRLRNRLATRSIIVHGLRTHPAAAGDTIRVAAGAVRSVTFDAGAPGTYYYWGALADSVTVDAREGIDSQLTGALIVDPATGPIAPDRVFVIGMFAFPGDSTSTPRRPTRFGAVINGLSWPYTERFDLAVGDTVHWRWINATAANHPLHLHGFFFRIDARGTEGRDTAYTPERRRSVVTERMDEGSTMTMTWGPARPGNWVLHCHIRAHAAVDWFWGLTDSARAHAHPGAEMPAGRMNDMAGLVLGIRVRPRPPMVASNAKPMVKATSAMKPLLAAIPAEPVHRIRIVIGPSAGSDTVVRIASTLEDPGWVAGRDTGSYPGPLVLLERGKPAAITVVNELPQPTVVHWHGIELESYYDGVAGWSGDSTRTTPVIAPHDSFVARMTPPRAGTFMYHAHMQSTTQVGDGLYGPIVVLGEGERWDPSSEVIWMVGGRDLRAGYALTLDGRHAPPPLLLALGHRYRVRIANISEDNTGDIALLADSVPVEWRPLAKDAARLPAAYTASRPARVRTSVGETYDFELVPRRAGELRLEVRNTGHLQAVQRVYVR